MKMKIYNVVCPALCHHLFVSECSILRKGFQVEASEVALKWGLDLQCVYNVKLDPKFMANIMILSVQFPM